MASSAKTFWVVITDQAGRHADYERALSVATSRAADHPFDQFIICRAVTLVEAKGSEIVVEEIGDDGVARHPPATPR